MSAPYTYIAQDIKDTHDLYEESLILEECLMKMKLFPKKR